MRLFLLIGMLFGCEAAPIGAAFDDLSGIDLRDGRSAQDFATAWRATYDAEEPALARMVLGDDWVGRQYRWTAYALAGLCRDTTCSVRLLPTAEVHRHRLGGGMARVRFTPDAMARLTRECSGEAGCEVEFEGMLTRARTSPELPLRLDFEGGRVHAVRAPDARWFARPKRAPIKDKGDLRTGESVKPAFRLRGQTF